MAKKSAKSDTQENTSVSTEVSKTTVTNVKAIKNSLFKDLEIGQSVMVGGIIRTVTSKSGNFGDYTEFKGDFGCVHGDATYRGTKLFLPSVAADVLKNQYLDVVENLDVNSDVTRVKIEFKIRLTKSADENPKNAAGFQWTFENLADTQQERDPVLLLLG